VAGSITDFAGATADEINLTPGSASGSITTTVNPSADLTVTLAGSANTTLAGQSLTYTLTVVNHGPSDDPGVTLFDTLPNFCTFLSANPSQGGATQVGNSVTANLGMIAAGSSASVTIKVAPTIDAIGTIVDAVSASAGLPDPNTNDNSASVTTTVAPGADLSVSVTPSSPTVLAGQNITYTVIVANAGPSTATGVTLADALPAGMSFVSGHATQGNVTFANGAVSATLGTLFTSSSATVTIVALEGATGSGQVVDTAHVAASQGDPNPANNDGQCSVAVNPNVDLSVTINDNPDPAPAGQPLTYTVTVSNNGQSAATTVILTDTLPANATFVSVVAQQGTASALNGVVTASLGALARGSSTIVTIVVQPTVAAIGSIIDAASVSSPEGDSNAANNSFSQTTTVQAAAALSLTITAAPATVHAGDMLTYTLTVSNAGPNTATNVGLSDLIPANAVVSNFSSSQGSVTKSGGQIQAALGQIAVGGSATVTVTVQTTAGAGSAGSIIDSATAIADEINPTPANARASLTTIVIPSADLALTLAQSADSVLTAGAVTYTATIKNLGINDATGVAVTDLVPAGSTIVSASASQGSVSPFQPTDSEISAALGFLAAGSTATVTIVARAPGSTGSLIDLAAVYSNELDPDPANNVASRTTQVTLPNSDLQVTLAAAPGARYLGQNLTFTAVVSNSGPDAAAGVLLSLPAPNGAQFVSANLAQGTYQFVGNTLQANIGSLLAGAHTTVMVTLQATAAGALSQTATVSGTVIDSNPTNDSASAQSLITPATDLVVTQSVSPTGVVTAGQNVAYTITVSNHGPLATTNTTFGDNLPSGATFVSLAPGAFSRNGQVVTGSLGGLAVGESRSMTLVLQLSASGISTNIMTVSSNMPNLDAAGGSNAQSVTVNSAPTSAIQLSAAAYTANETDGALTIAVNRLPGSTGPVSLQYQTVDGSAVAGSDYVASASTISFAAGETTKVISIPILDPKKIGGSTAFGIILSNPSTGAVLGTHAAAVVTIIDNDLPLVVDGPRIISIQRFGSNRNTSQIVLTFNEPLNLVSASNLADYTLISAGKTGQFSGKGTQVLGLSSARYNLAANTVTLQVKKPFSLNHLYKLTANGSTPAGVSDASGHLLDGKGNGQAGSDFVSLLKPSDHVLKAPKTPKGPIKKAGGFHLR
jgi:large repetitive protein